MRVVSDTDFFWHGLCLRTPIFLRTRCFSNTGSVRERGKFCTSCGFHVGTNFGFRTLWSDSKIVLKCEFSGEAKPQSYKWCMSVVAVWLKMREIPDQTFPYLLKSTTTFQKLLASWHSRVQNNPWSCCKAGRTHTLFLYLGCERCKLFYAYVHVGDLFQNELWNSKRNWKVLGVCGGGWTSGIDTLKLALLGRWHCIVLRYYAMLSYFFDKVTSQIVISASTGSNL